MTPLKGIDFKPLMAKYTSGRMRIRLINVRNLGQSAIQNLKDRN